MAKSTITMFKYHQIMYDLTNHNGFEKQFRLLNSEERLTTYYKVVGLPPMLISGTI